jgi:hypothetical protein
MSRQNIKLSNPRPIMTSDPGSFAQSTIIERKPVIIQQVLHDNDYTPDTSKALYRLQEEIASGTMQPIREYAEDVDFWNFQLSIQPGQTWRDAPWYFAESFFYRRLLEAVGYFQPGPGLGRDPFRQQKLNQMIADLRCFERNWREESDAKPAETFLPLFRACLWGNRTDLSQATDNERRRMDSTFQPKRESILIDDTEIVQFLFTRTLRQMDVITDNVGMELLNDLALADWILKNGKAKQIHFHLKRDPFFISDAMPADMRFTLDQLIGSANPDLARMGKRLIENDASQQLDFTTSPFWTSCLMFRDMPSKITEDLNKSELTILKGDLNYRRLLGDLHWPTTTKLEEIVEYFPSSLVAIRTLKSEIIVGMLPGQAEVIAKEDPDWLINGKRGIIQFVQKQLVE